MDEFVAGSVGYRSMSVDSLSAASTLQTSTAQSSSTSSAAKQAGGDAVGLRLFGTLYLRIFIMQTAIIFGGMLAQRIRLAGAAQIVIGCKTLVDLSVASRRSPAINSMTIAR